MSISFHFAALSENDRDQALPIIQATFPGVALSSWRKFFENLERKGTSSPSGILTMRDNTGGICGILAYRCDLDLLEGLSLTVPLFTVADLTNSPILVEALLEAALAQAQTLKCETLRIHLADCQTALADRLRKIKTVLASRSVLIRVPPALMTA